MADHPLWPADVPKRFESASAHAMPTLKQPRAKFFDAMNFALL
jgi:hypothetical protein